jgi:hypothetical protein
MFWLTHRMTELQNSQYVYGTRQPHSASTGLDSNIPQHNQRVRNNIGNTHPQRRPDGLVDHILQHHHTNTTSKTASHSRKAHEQHDSRLPRDTIPTVAETITGQARLVYAVDDEHAEG